MNNLIFYKPENKNDWNEVVNKSRSGNFIHLRNYMDYNSARFNEVSIILYKSGKPLAIFPANEENKTVYSHQGLTYAGLISNEALSTEDTLNFFSALVDLFKQKGFERIVYKSIPYIFHKYPCQEDLYALSTLGASLIRRDLSSVINLKNKSQFLKLNSKNNIRNLNKAKKADLYVEESADLRAFYHILENALIKYDAKPTHTLEELVMLFLKNKKKMRLFLVYQGLAVIAGTVIYDFGKIIHTQYLANTKEGRKHGALDFLIEEILTKIFPEKNYLSLGISTYNDGKNLNFGLMNHKEGLAGRGVVHDFYELKI